MTPEEKTALEMSIAHHKKNEDICRRNIGQTLEFDEEEQAWCVAGEYILMGPKNCALCILHRSKNVPACSECVIYRKTKKRCCSGTPYNAIEDELLDQYNGSDLTEELADAFAEEVEFLEGLLP